MIYGPLELLTLIHLKSFGFVFTRLNSFLVLSHRKQSKLSCNVPMTNIKGIEQH